MPCQVMWERGGAVKRFYGHVTEREFVGSSEEVATDERFDSLRYIISDYTAVAGHDISPRGVEAVAVIRLGAWATNPHIRSLVIATDVSPGSIGEVARLRPLLKSHETTVFPTLDEARVWLGRQPSPFAFRSAQTQEFQAIE